MAIIKLSTQGTITAPTNSTTIITNNVNSVTKPPQSYNSDIRKNPTQSVGWSGIKFPFRFTPNGKVATSTTSPTDPSHIRESVEQILMTSFRERVLLPNFGSPLDALVFESMTDIAGAYEAMIIKSLQIWEKRITVLSTQITPDVENDGVYINLSYYINSYQPSAPYYHSVLISRA